MCFATQNMCNYRLAVHKVLVTRGGERWDLAPGERATAQLEGSAYEIENQFAAQHGSVVPGAPICAASQQELDAISIVQKP